MKTCTSCNIEKDLSHFTYDKSRDRHMSMCRPCMAKRTNEYRLKNMDKWRNNDKKHSEKYKQVFNEWRSQGCSRCDEKRPWVIDAHHVRDKSFSIGTTKRGIKILKEELKKCIPLCANCHRDLHYQENK